MADDQDFEIIIGSLISSSSSDYKVQDFLGFGTFGVVTQCRKLATNETVALKILKGEKCIEEAKEEEAILKMMKKLDSDKFNIIRWNDSFTYDGCYCLEFEKLDMNLYEFLQRNEYQCLELKEIRPMMQQLAIALEFLKTTKIVHADLKPENIMMVDHLWKPLRVKIIDFGLACNNPEALTGAIVQSQWYRSPEVLLGASFNEAIDVWSLGCIAAEMFMGITLFPGSDEYDMMRHIVYTIGKPPDHLLNAGLYTEQFFHANYSDLEPHVWRFMSALEVRNFTCTPRTISSLNDLMTASCKLSREDASADECDRASFVDLITQMLKLDASERITPSQILQHPFITMSHLFSTFSNSLYLKSCMELMSICQGLNSDNGGDMAQTTLKTCLTEDTSNSTACPADHSDPMDSDPAGLSNKEHPFHQSTIIRRENSSAKKRKGDGLDDAQCSNTNPDISPAKKSRSECLDATDTSRQTRPRKSPMQTHDTDVCITSDGNFPPKKKNSINLKKELTDSIKKLLSNSEGAQSSLTEFDHLKKRMRDDEEASGSNKTSPDKRRRGSLDGGEG